MKPTPFTIVSLVFLTCLVFSSCGRKSGAISDSLATMNIGLIQERNRTENKNDMLIGMFQSEAVANPKDNKRKKILHEAIEVAKRTKVLIDNIENLKVETVMHTDGINEEVAERRVKEPLTVKNKSNYRKPTSFLGLEFGTQNRGKLYDLKNEILEYRKFLLTVVSNSSNYQKIVTERYLEILNIEDSTFKRTNESTWEVFYFSQVPLSGILAELTRWQCIVRESESEVLSFLWDEISITTFKFDAVAAAIVPKSYSVELGSNFEADVFLQGYSTSVYPLVSYGTHVDTSNGMVTNEKELNRDQFTKDGKGQIKVPATSLGEKTCEGVIKIVSPVTRNIVPYPFKVKYTVVPKK